MAMDEGYYPTCKYTATLPDPVQGAGAFVANGASAITKVSGIVESVRRLATAGAVPFFRIKLNSRIDVTAITTIITGDVRGTAATDEPAKNIINLTASPASARGTFEFDVVLLNAGTPVDTAGFRFDFHVDASQGRIRQP
jgi:hypothetical protein